MSKQKMLAAKELIKEKRYDEARAILKTVDHPIALEWLQKLDKIAPEKPTTPKRKTTKEKSGGSITSVIKWIFRNRHRRLVQIAIVIVAIMGCALFSYIGQMFNIIPTAAELNATKTVQAVTQQVALAGTADAQSATDAAQTQAAQMTANAQSTTDTIQTQVAQMTINAQATNIALTPTATETASSTPTVTPTLTNTPTVTSTPNPAAFNEAEYVRYLDDGLFLLAGGRNIDSIQVADGRPNGGERVIIITYLTTETTEAGLVEEWIDIFSAVAAVIEANRLDVDSISLVMGSGATGEAVGILVSSVADLLAYHKGELTQAAFLLRLQITAF